MFDSFRNTELEQDCEVQVQLPIDDNQSFNYEASEDMLSLSGLLVVLK